MNFFEAVVKFKKLNTEEENDSRALFAPADESDRGFDYRENNQYQIHEKK